MQNCLPSFKENENMTAPLFLIRDWLLKTGQTIPAGSLGFSITKEYLERSRISPDEHLQLLELAFQAEKCGARYVHFEEMGLYAQVSQEDVL